MTSFFSAMCSSYSQQLFLSLVSSSCKEVTSSTWSTFIWIIGQCNVCTIGYNEFIIKYHISAQVMKSKVFHLYKYIICFIHYVIYNYDHIINSNKKSKNYSNRNKIILNKNGLVLFLVRIFSLGIDNGLLMIHMLLIIKSFYQFLMESKIYNNSNLFKLGGKLVQLIPQFYIFSSILDDIFLHFLFSILLLIKVKLK